MKRIGLFFVIAFVLLFGMQNTFAAANGTVRNKATYHDEGAPGSEWVHYYGSATTVATDSIGTHYTKAMWIADYTAYNAYFYMVMSNDPGGTEDCNVYVEYSFDRTTWFAGSAASGKIKDALSTTAVSDTLNIVDGVNDTNYKMGLWCRLKFDYQAGNPIGTTLTWHLIFRKNPDSPYKQSKVWTDLSS